MTEINNNSVSIILFIYSISVLFAKLYNYWLPVLLEVHFYTLNSILLLHLLAKLFFILHQSLKHAFIILFIVLLLLLVLLLVLILLLLLILLLFLLLFLLLLLLILVLLLLLLFILILLLFKQILYYS